MTLTFRNRLHRYGAVILTIITVFYLVTGSARGWLSYVYAGDPPPGGLEDAIALEGDNSDFHFLLGQFYDNYDYTVPRSEAYSYYKTALELNPLNYNYWFYLAEYLSRLGERDKALFALKQATELSPGVVSLRWGAGMLASKLGDRDALLDNLGAVIANDPGRRQKAFVILWQSLRNGDQISPIIPEQAIPDYLEFLVTTKRAPEAYEIWSDNRSLVNYNLFMLLMNFLIYQNEIELAKNAWSDRMGRWDGVWNGGFEENINNNGFDWTMGGIEGAGFTRVKSSNDRGYTMSIEFDGKHNYDFYHFRQVVPVEENSRYLLGSDMKSDGITTLNGVFWEVYCLHGDGLYAKSQETYGTTDWHRVELTFETPPGCDSAVVRLRRHKSGRTDSALFGTVWLDNVVLEKEG